MTDRILIVGAGLAGLAIAQGLRRAAALNASVPAFHVFETDGSPTLRSQGYRVRINPLGAAALRSLLPDALWAAFEATSAPIIDKSGGPSKLHPDLHTGVLTAWKRPPGGGPGGSPGMAPPQYTGRQYNADRAVLRNLLLTGLQEEGVLTYGRALTHYAVEDGRVHVHFSDGSVETGSVLIGADGVYSAVRTSLLTTDTAARRHRALAIVDTEGRGLYGKAPLTAELRARVAPALLDGISLAGDDMHSHIKLFTDIMHFDAAAAAAATTAPSLSHVVVPADYLYWVLLFRRDLPGAEAAGTEPAADTLRRLTGDWHVSLRTVVDNDAGDDVALSTVLRFLTCTSAGLADAWKPLPADATPTASEAGPVTVIGDAAHPMPPVGGIGANNAFLDAADVCQGLLDVFDGPAGDRSAQVAAALSAYEGRMYERVGSVPDRVAGTGHFFGMRPLTDLLKEQGL